MLVDYPWYEIINGPNLQQGDFIFNLDVPIVERTNSEEIPVKIETFNAIVMTQSCDIPKDAIEYVVLCPVWDIADAVRFNSQFSNPRFLGQVKKDRILGFYLLNRCELPGYECDYRVVQFERVIVRPKKTILEILSPQDNHLRLLPPYREQMAQRFGIFFSRVASPQEIPSFEK